jgi:hypothetical protein
MRGDEAKKACPEIQLVQVPVARGKANLNTYRNAGSEVIHLSRGAPHIILLILFRAVIH